jgi:Kef-type K+ transport system membrane component KefB
VFASTPSILEQMKSVSVEDLLLPLLLQAALILGTARIFAVLFRRLGQPAVVGEIVAGLILGPSALGRLFPEAFRVLFHPTLGGLPPEASDLLLGRVLNSLAEIGLLLLLFLIGLEFDLGHLRWNGPPAVAVSLAGTAVPFALGVGLGAWMHAQVASDIPWLPFVLFLGTATAITAIPVLGRILLDLGISRARLSSVVLAAAAVGDAGGWILLASVAALARSYRADGAAFDPTQTAVMVSATAGFGLGMFLLARPLLVRFARRAVGPEGEMSLEALTATLVVLLLCAAVTNLIGIFAVFGAFTLGAVLSGEHAFRDAVNRRLRDLVTVFFLPLFFAYTGLRTRVDALDTWHLWGLTAAVFAVAVLGKFGGCSLAAWLGGLSRREAACVGALMNTRGLMELVVINVGKDLGVIPDSVYCMLVLMAIGTTLMTTPLLLLLMRGTELEPLVRQSGFLRPARSGQSPLRTHEVRGSAANPS